MIERRKTQIPHRLISGTHFHLYVCHILAHRWSKLSICFNLTLSETTFFMTMSHIFQASNYHLYPVPLPFEKDGDYCFASVCRSVHL